MVIGLSCCAVKWTRVGSNHVASPCTPLNVSCRTRSCSPNVSTDQPFSVTGTASTSGIMVSQNNPASLSQDCHSSIFSWLTTATACSSPRLGPIAKNCWLMSVASSSSSINGMAEMILRPALGGSSTHLSKISLLGAKAITLRCPARSVSEDKASALGSSPDAIISSSVRE